MSNDTRERLVRAAEDQFAKHGVLNVSLRQITRAADAKNAVALQYHFQDREGILRAILERHWLRIEPARMQMLDEIEAQGDATVRDYAEALVIPSAMCLRDPDGGPEYLRIYNELHERGVSPLDLRRVEDWQRSVVRWRRMVRPLMDPIAVKLHRRYIAIRVASGELARLALYGPTARVDTTVSHIVDVVAAVLAAPVSDRTSQGHEQLLEAEAPKPVTLDADPHVLRPDPDGASIPPHPDA